MREETGLSATHSPEKPSASGAGRVRALEGSQAAVAKIADLIRSGTTPEHAARQAIEAAGRLILDAVDFELTCVNCAQQLAADYHTHTTTESR